MGFLDFLTGGGGGAKLQDLISEGGGGGGISELFSNLFQNKMFLQYLSGLGGALSSGQPIGASLNNITQQNISSQNALAVLKKMLAGNVPEGGKLTIDNKAATFNIPTSALSVPTGGLGPTGQFQMGKINPADMGGTAGITSTPLSQPASPNVQGEMNFLNPFEPGQLGGISASDLAGLNPDDLYKMMQLKLQQQELGQKRMSDLVDMLYKQGLLDYYAGNIEEGRERLKLARGEEVRKWVDLAMKDDRPASVQEFEFAKTPEGGGYEGTFDEFKNPDNTSEWRNYIKAGKNDPKFKMNFFDYQKSLREAGRQVIGLPAKLEEHTALDQLETRKFFSGNWTKAADTLDIRNPLPYDLYNKYVKSGMKSSEAESAALVDAKLITLRNEIESRGLKITDSIRRGDTYIFKVHFPDIVDQSGRVVLKGEDRDLPYVIK